MKLKIYNDLHLYGPHEIRNVLEYDKEAYYLGDNIDLIYCRRNEIQEAELALKVLKSTFEDRFISGNHEGSRDNLYKIINDDVLLIHGDLIMESQEYVDKVRGENPPRGASWFVRFWVWLYESILPGQPYFLWENKIQSAAAFAKALGCKTVIMGHNHPAKRYDKTIDNVRIIGLKRGYNEIEI